MNPKSILLKGYYGFGNFGDDILMRCAFEELRRRFPNASIDIFSNNTRTILKNNSRYDYNQYIRSILPSEVQLIDWTFKRHYDLIVHGGGGVFGSLTDSRCQSQFLRWGSFSAPVIGRVASVMRQILRRPAHLTANQTIACGVGIGTLFPLSRSMLHSIEELASIDRLAVRDEISHARARQLQLGTVTRRFTDLAFGLNWRTSKSRALLKQIGIIPCQGRAGTDEMLKLAKTDSHRFKIVILDENHDEDLIKQIEEAGLDPIVWRPHALAIDAFLAKWERFEFVITNRAHGGILSAIMGISPLLIASDFKLASVHAMLPNGSIVINPFLSDLDLLAEVLRAYEHNSELQLGLQRDVTANRLQIEPMYEFALG